MTEAIVFLGPTMPVDAARRILDVDYWPPAQCGDVLRALYAQPKAIGLIDGCFHSVASVWHKELLVALERGVRVYGSASMGALRAAELHAFGMVGVGEIFESYRSEAIEDDDEVAIVHAPGEWGFRPLSDAMVDIRDAYAAAVRCGVLPQRVATQLLDIAKGLHYVDRSHRTVMAHAGAQGIGTDVLDRLGRFLAGYGPTLKQRDAAAMLETIAGALEEGITAQPGVPVERTPFLAALEAEVERTRLLWGRLVLRPETIRIQAPPDGPQGRDARMCSPWP